MCLAGCTGTKVFATSGLRRSHAGTPSHRFLVAGFIKDMASPTQALLLALETLNNVKR
jgi:hypothetical protein